MPSLDKPRKYNLHGVTTMISAVLLSDYVKALPYAVAYVITTEERNTPKEHVHFYLTSDDRQLNRTRFRKEIKDHFKLEITKNGQFNIDVKVKDPIQCITYLCKEGFPEHVHCFGQAFIKKCSRNAYSKKVSMTTAIKRLQDLLVKEQLTPLEYTVEYRLCRKKYKKPDPNWTRQYENAFEQMKSDDTIREECNDYEQRKLRNEAMYV